MKKVNVFANDTKTIAYSSAKGNQTKYKVDGKWVKLDYLGYEGLAEKVCYQLSKFRHVTYETIKVSGKLGCVSEDFIQNKEFITLQDLLYRLPDKCNPWLQSLSPEKSLRLLVASLKEYFDLDTFEYIVNKLIFDFVVLNEDCHLNNIGFLMSNGRLEIAPYFDFGLSLLADMSFNIHDIEKIRFKPFDLSYAENLEFLLGLGIKIDINSIPRIEDSLYSREIIDRIQYVLNFQIRKSKDLLFLKDKL